MSSNFGCMRCPCAGPPDRQLSRQFMIFYMVIVESIDNKLQIGGTPSVYSCTYLSTLRPLGVTPL